MRTTARPHAIVTSIELLKHGLGAYLLTFSNYHHEDNKWLLTSGIES